MKRTLLTSIMLLAFFSATAESKRYAKARAEVLSQGKGYYKEVFMDGGVALTSRRHLPATQLLDIEIDNFVSADTKKLTKADTLQQKAIFCGNKYDTNGRLLYPDGAPRYRMIYVNGGKSGAHARSLGEEGRQRIQEYIAAGGSYVGTCAGAYIASSGSIRSTGPKYSDIYWGLWPGWAKSTRLIKSSTAMKLPKRSPLLQYFDFGQGRTVKEVRHNGGCAAYDEKDNRMPKGTEVLARYIFSNTDRVKIDGKASVWAYKANAESGRVVMCGSHPEGAATGERLEFMAAMMLYAMDGNPAPKVKGTLQGGEVREMNKLTEDNDPAYTRIGDRQYHHFRLEVPRKCKRMTITLEGYKGTRALNLTLCAKRGELAFHDNTLLKSVGPYCKEQIVVENPKAGEWFTSVFCESTPITTVTKYGTHYRGRLAVLNGVPYKISVKYE